MLQRKTIVLIDDEPTSVQPIRDALLADNPEMKLASTTMQLLREYYDCVGIVLEPEPLDSLPARATLEIQQKAPAATVIMVDLSFDRRNREGAVEIGRGLALALQDEFTDAAVGVYTKHPLDPIQYARYGSDGFAFMFPDVLRMIQGPKRLSGDEWATLFDKFGSQTQTHNAQTKLPSPIATATAVAPRIFVGSSTEHRDLANMLAKQLNDEFEAVPWRLQPSMATSDFIGGFLKNLDDFNCGVFVFAPDDELRLRDQTYAAVRDNVVLELGIFLGRYGRERSFIVEPDDSKTIRHLSDLQGYTTLRYRRSTWDEGRRDAAMAKVVSELFEILKAK